MSRIPTIEEKIISFPFLRRSGSPEEVRTVALPARTARKAIPPETPKTMESIDLTKNSGLVERHPKTV